MYVVTDGKNKWVGEGKVNTGKGVVDVHDPPAWAHVFPAKPVDMLDKFKRGPQVMHPKDIGVIIAYTGLSPGWVVVEGGSGSGFLTAYIANIVKPGKVYSYETNKKFLEIARENVKKAGLDNVIFKNRSVFEFEEEVDLVIFDVPNPWEGVDRVRENLKEGGFFVSYLPTANQVVRWIKATKKGFFSHRILTVNEVEWRVKEDAFRPKSKTLAHTAFICIARRV